MSNDAAMIPDWLENPDVVLLRDVATAVARLDEVGQLDSFALPYPPDAQRALDRLVLACLRGGAQPPTGVPEMIGWCRTRPLRSWPLDALPLDLFRGTTGSSTRAPGGRHSSAANSRSKGSGTVPAASTPSW